MKKIIMFVFMILVMAVQSKAENLIMIAETPTHYVYGVENTLESIEQFRTIWTQHVYKPGGAKARFKNVPKLHSGVTEKQHWVINCETREVMYLEYIIYNERGRVIHKEKESISSRISFDSVESILYNITCN